jgi:long-chain acyl-CoA synthetase
VTAHALADLCRAQLESYKVPKRFFVCTDWPMTASGKTDHSALALQLQLQQQLQMQFQPQQQLHSLDEKAPPCLRPLL